MIIEFLGLFLLYLGLTTVWLAICLPRTGHSINRYNARKFPYFLWNLLEESQPYYVRPLNFLFSTGILTYELILYGINIYLLKPYILCDLCEELPSVKTCYSCKKNICKSCSTTDDEERPYCNFCLAVFS